MSTYNRVVAADETARLAPTVRARLATEMADPTSDVGASLSDTFAHRLSGRDIPEQSALPTMMTTPPTFTFVGVGTPASTITDAVTVSSLLDPSTIPSAISPQFAYRGGPWVQAGSGATADRYMAKPKVLTGDLPAAMPFIEFDFYGLEFEFVYKGAGNLVSRVWVDGQYAEPVYTADTTLDGAGHRRKVTFATVGWRRIRLEMGAFFWKVDIGPTDILVPVSPNTEKLLIIHDSYGGGTGAELNGGYAMTVSQMLGFPEVVNVSQGGTGVLVANGVRPKYRGRSGDWAALEATSALIGLSGNDAGESAADIIAELLILIPIVQALPGMKDVWVMGDSPRGGGDVASTQSRDSAVEAGIASLGVPFISLVNPNTLWSGTGSVEAPTGLGTSDILYHSAGTYASHPTQVGHDAIARLFAARLRAVRPAP